MKKQLHLFGIFFIAISLAFVSCDKDEDEDSNKTTSEYLRAGFWKTTAMTIDPGVNVGGVTLTDFFAQLEACTKDDLIKFNSDGSITDDEGATKCDVNDPQTTTEGSWVLSADNKMLTISYPGDDDISLTITTINDNTLQGSYTVEEDFGSGLLLYTISVTLSRA